MSPFKALEVDNSIIFNLAFTSNTLLLCLFFFFIIIDLYLLIHAVIARTFNPIAELINSIGITSREAKAELEIPPENKETKIRTC